MDAAHGKRLAVCLDVVYDYFGNSHGFYKLVMGAATILIGLVSIGGLLALFVGAQRVAEVAMR